MQFSRYGGNKLKVLRFPMVLTLLLMCSAGVLAAQYIPEADDFESYAVGTYFTTVTTSPPSPVSDAWGDSATYAAGLRYNIVETAELDGNPANKVVHIVDVPDATTKNGHLRTNFWPAAPWQTSGIFEVTMDVKPLQDDGPFKITMTNGAGWTNGGNWLCAIGFGSTAGNTFFPGIATPGARLFVQRTTTTAWDETGFDYYANTWYTVKFIVDVDLKKFQIFFGPHGGALSEITSGPTPWITGAATPPTAFGGMIVATSNKTNEGAELLLDNVLERRIPQDRIVWDSFSRADNWQLGATEDPNHYTWENGYNSLASITGKEMVFGTITQSSDGAFLNNYAPSGVDISARVRSVGGNGAGIAYRKDPTKEAGNPGFGYRLFWSQDGTSVKLSYQWYGSDYSSTTYTPATPIDWTVPHTVRIRAVGSSHKVWLDGNLIIDWNDSNRLTGGHVVFYRVLSEYHVDDFVMLDASTAVSSVASAKAQAAGTDVTLSGTGMHVVGAFDGYFYLEDDDRAAGIKVVSATSVAVGNGVSLKGAIKSADGEKYIEATSVTPDSASVNILPLAMTNKAHGTGGKLPNIGLLCRIWGRVTYLSPLWDFFYVDDGSGVSYESGTTGIKVYNYDGWVVPNVDYYVGCTGVASMDPGGIPVIRMRSSLDDLRIFWPPL